MLPDTRLIFWDKVLIKLRSHFDRGFEHNIPAQLSTCLITLSMMCEFRPCFGSFENHDRRQHMLYS